MKVLVVLSHSYQDQSVSNKAIGEEYAKAGFEVHNLEQLYPDGKIDVAREQAAVEAADLIIFQHPIHWYCMPPMLKRWQDEVQAYGWAYGTGGDKMQGKKFLHAYTTGTPREKYDEKTIEELSASLHTSATFVGMEWLEPMGTFGHLAMVNPNAEAQARTFAQRVIDRVKSL